MEMTIIVLNRHSELDSESPMRERPSSCAGDGGFPLSRNEAAMTVKVLGLCYPGECFLCKLNLHIYLFDD